MEPSRRGSGRASWCSRRLSAGGRSRAGLRGPRPGPSRSRPSRPTAAGSASPRLSPDGEKVAYAWAGPTTTTGTSTSRRWARGRSRCASRRIPPPTGAPPGRPMAGRSRSCASPRTTPPRSTRSPRWAGRSASSSTSSGPRRRSDGSTLLPMLSWAPDGEWLAFAEKASEDAPARIVRLSLATLEKRPLTSPPPESLGDLEPQISPDGRLLAFVRSGARSYGNQDVWVQPVSGGEARRLTSGQYGFASALSWTPDGAEIVFTTAARTSAAGGSPGYRWRAERPSRSWVWGRMRSTRPSAGSSWCTSRARLRLLDIWRLPRPGASRSTETPAEVSRLRRQRGVLTGRPEDRLRVGPGRRQQHMAQQCRRLPSRPAHDLRRANRARPDGLRTGAGSSSTRSRPGTGTSTSSAPTEGHPDG